MLHYHVLHYHVLHRVYEISEELLGRGMCLAWEEACSLDFSLKSCRDVHILDG